MERGLKSGNVGYPTIPNFDEFSTTGYRIVRKSGGGTRHARPLTLLAQSSCFVELYTLPTSVHTEGSLSESPRPTPHPCTQYKELVEEQGLDLAGVIRAGTEEFPAAYNSVKVLTHKGLWKLIEFPGGFELYNLKEDPHEANNIFNDAPRVRCGVAWLYLDLQRCPWRAAATCAGWQAAEGPAVTPAARGAGCRS